MPFSFDHAQGSAPSPAAGMDDRQDHRLSIRVRGTVQGVGFRPFVFRLAVSNGLAGWVRNRSGDVEIEVQGPAAALRRFLDDLEQNPPPLARIARLDVRPLLPQSRTAFEIHASQACDDQTTCIPPDAATCDACILELFDPGNRRHGYPFINCTDCGPRFTIARAPPYDRQRTTMAAFAMCPDCHREFNDPADRRFHAQPNACPRCGPTLRLLRADMAHVACADPITYAAQRLCAGDVVAVKGLGGYHLAVDASNERAVARLRHRKGRDNKPFAMMVADICVARELCSLSHAEQRLLESSRRPIVLLRRREGASCAASVAPGQRDLGIMLPYTPVHHLLMRAVAHRGHRPVLVMTSGNPSDSPITFRDDEALASLGSIADLFLTHDRPIERRCDDSVTRPFAGGEMLIRRSRGYAPEPIKMGFEFPQTVLACGADLKNTFCIGRGGQAFVSHHIGDLEDYETFDSFGRDVKRFEEMLNAALSMVAHDMHPGYHSTRYALGLPQVRTLAVQHHHAHIASVLAEHGLNGPVIGVAFDGTGYGTDGHIWGGEFLIADLASFRRAAHLQYIPMPGGEQAIREPWRMAAAWLDRAFADAWLDMDLPCMRGIERHTWRTLRGAIAAGINCPRTSSMGRLFDAVAAIVTGCTRASYEGQAAIALESVADANTDDAYSFQIHDGPVLTLDPVPVIRSIIQDQQSGVSAGVIAARFHHAAAAVAVQVCKTLRQRYDVHTVALSGGVFQNVLLLERLYSRLRGEGFEVCFNRRVPPNDGGISLGQAAVAAATLGDRKCV